MKHVLFFFLVISLGFVGGVTVVRWNGWDFASNLMFQENSTVAKSRFIPTSYPLKNQSFTVIIVGKNNGASVERTLNSVLSQNYENFRIVYIDDGSDDGSFELVRDLIYETKHLIPIMLTRHEQSLGVLVSLKQTIENCADEEIVVFVEGNDWLAHEWVLQRLNQYYADPDLWMTYGEFRNYPTFELGEAALFAEGGVRAATCGKFHLQTFYAALFKKVQESDFMYLGKFFHGAAPLAYMSPMLEMANQHCQYLSDILYIANPDVVEASSLEAEALFEKYVRSLPSYSPIAFLFESVFVEENEI